ncbi:MAG: hypothetical protein Q4F95_12920 [Oscillospiraceae bacterium]|nr:hypothetical protein [Oscillospiraceae bacterium]
MKYKNTIPVLMTVMMFTAFCGCMNEKKNLRNSTDQTSSSETETYISSDSAVTQASGHAAETYAGNDNNRSENKDSLPDKKNNAESDKTHNTSGDYDDVIITAHEKDTEKDTSEPDKDNTSAADVNTDQEKLNDNDSKNSIELPVIPIG